MTGAALHVAGLSKVFGGLRAVDDVSLSVAAGERRVLIGPNGAGKTTLFHCITGTLPPSAGRITMFGDDVSRLDEPARTRRGMRRTFQITNVFKPLTVLENLALATLGKDRRKWVMGRGIGRYGDVRSAGLQALEMVGLADRAHDTADRLSYGERRQLELALALQTGPKILFLDEPCAGLSPSERQRISRLIASLPRDITLLMIEHDMDVALALADSVTVLHRGSIIVEGSPAQVQADPEVREVYFGDV